MATLKDKPYMPVPAGISLTVAPKSRPWVSPPKHVKVSDVAQLYVDKMSKPSAINSLLDVVESKVPLATTAESLMMAGVQQGLHTLDVGILVTPVIIEMLKTVAELHGVEYKVFGAEDGDNAVPDRVIREALTGAATKNTPKEIAQEKAPKVELSGLMARKGEA